MYVLLFGRRYDVFVSGFFVVFLSFLLLSPDLVCFSCSLRVSFLFLCLLDRFFFLIRLFVAWCDLVAWVFLSSRVSERLAGVL